MNSSPALRAIGFALVGLVFVVLGWHSLQRGNTGIAVIQWLAAAAGIGRALLARSPSTQR